MTADTSEHSLWSRALKAATLFAVDPIGTGGVVLRGPTGPARDRWLSFMRSTLSPSAPVRRISSTIAEGRLLGGLDLAATLKAGRMIAERGALAESDGGVVIVTMAERMAPAMA